MDIGADMTNAHIEILYCPEENDFKFEGPEAVLP